MNRNHWLKKALARVGRPNLADARPWEWVLWIKWTLRCVHFDEAHLRDALALTWTWRNAARLKPRRK